MGLPSQGCVGELQPAKFFERTFICFSQQGNVTSELIMNLNREMMVRVAEASIVETIEAFVRFRPGFHGDTGIRDYLYHRLMTGLPNGGTHTRGKNRLEQEEIAA